MGDGRDFQPRSCTREASSDCVLERREKRTDDFLAVTLEDRTWTGTVEGMGGMVGNVIRPSIRPSIQPFGRKNKLNISNGERRGHGLRCHA